MANQPIINSLTDKVKRLIEQDTALSTQRDELKKECEKLGRQNRELRSQVADLQHKVAKLELSQGLAAGAGSTANDSNAANANDNGESKRRARGRINQLLREIDRCIALMTKDDEEERTE